MNKSSKNRISAIHERDQSWMEFDKYFDIVSKICEKIYKDQELNQEDVDIVAKCTYMIYGELCFRRAERLIIEKEL